MYLCVLFVILLVADAKRKWKNLSDAYKKCLDRERDAQKSGAGASKTRTCAYYNELHFLKDAISNRTTSSNFHIPSISPSTPASSISPPAPRAF